MQSFESIIGGSAKQVKDIRVKNATRSIQTQSEMDVAKMVQDYRNMQNDLENSLDLGITNTTDVATNLKAIDPVKILNKVNTTAQSMAVLARKIKIAVKIHNTLFPTSKVTGLTDDGLDFLKDCI
jgi:hypothetical protein